MIDMAKTGKLVIIGGAEDKTQECEILREFVRLTGGVKSQIVVMTVASHFPEEIGRLYHNIFHKLGVTEVTIIDTRRPEDAYDPECLQRVQSATGVFFTGGNPSRIINLLQDTPLETLIQEKFRNGGVIGGTSAGAAIIPDWMIIEGSSPINPRLDSVTIGRGLGLLTGVIIDQHFTQRGRLGRLISALAQQSAMLGLGIDENTAIIVQENYMEVIGEGSVTIIDKSEKTYDNLSTVLKDENLAICGMKLHILPQGYGFDWQKQVPLYKNLPLPLTESLSWEKPLSWSIPLLT